MKIEVIGADQRARYDEVVAASPLADVMQSWGWGEVKAHTGWRPLRLLVVDDSGRARGACQVLRKTEVRGVPPLLYAPRGPIVDPGDRDALRALLEAIRARAGSAFVFKCDPAIPAGSDGTRALTEAGLRPVRGGAFGGTQPRAVMVLDLTPGADKVFEGFHSKWRYNVRLAERKGVTVREGERADLAAFHALYRTTAERDGFAPRAESYFRALFDNLAAVRMLIAEHDGEMLGAIVLMPMGERVMYTYGASSNSKRNLMPNHLVQWHAIRWACEAGYRIYDFRGVSPVQGGVPTESHLAGLNRFKEGFGARYVEYVGELDLPLRTGWYAAWRALAPAAIKVRARLRGSSSDDA